jgi:hypothetical protein
MTKPYAHRSRVHMPLQLLLLKPPFSSCLEGFPQRYTMRHVTAGAVVLPSVLLKPPFSSCLEGFRQRYTMRQVPWGCCLPSV